MGTGNRSPGPGGRRWARRARAGVKPWTNDVRAAHRSGRLPAGDQRLRGSMAETRTMLPVIEAFMAARSKRLGCRFSHILGSWALSDLSGTPAGLRERPTSSASRAFEGAAAGATLISQEPVGQQDRPIGPRQHDRCVQGAVPGRLRGSTVGTGQSAAADRPVGPSTGRGVRRQGVRIAHL